jgi:predicted translin family RNA/ssDNA-binding protein
MVNVPVPPSIAKENQSRFDQITALFQSIVPDISGLNAWRYQRQITWGIQEFIEALSFLHYIQTQTLISTAPRSGSLPAASPSKKTALIPWT